MDYITEFFSSLYGYGVSMGQYIMDYLNPVESVIHEDAKELAHLQNYQEQEAKDLVAALKSKISQVRHAVDAQSRQKEQLEQTLEHAEGQIALAAAANPQAVQAVEEALDQYKSELMLRLHKRLETYKEESIRPLGEQIREHRGTLLNLHKQLGELEGEVGVLSFKVGVANKHQELLKEHSQAVQMEEFKTDPSVRLN